MTSMNLKYRYAEKDGVVIDVTRMSREDHGSGARYTCIGCRKAVIPVLGEIRQKHFRHYDENVTCSKETYLHALAKSVIAVSHARAVRKGVPYWLRTSVKEFSIGSNEDVKLTCDHANCHHNVDLARIYKTSIVEAGIGEFVADVLLTQSTDNSHILIEIVVTHKSKKEKIQSGLPIIEIAIQSEHDIEQFTTGIDLKLSTVTPHNLASVPAVKECFSQCEFFRTVIVVDDKKWDYNSRNHPYLRIRDLMWKLRREARNGRKIENCLLCKYKFIGTHTNSVTCALTKEDTPLNQASKCPNFTIR